MNFTYKNTSTEKVDNSLKISELNFHKDQLSGRGYV